MIPRSVVKINVFLRFEGPPGQRDSLGAEAQLCHKLSAGYHCRVSFKKKKNSISPHGRKWKSAQKSGPRVKNPQFPCQSRFHLRSQRIN